MGKQHVLGGGLLALATALVVWLAFAPQNAPDTLYSDFTDWLGESLTKDQTLDERMQALRRFMASHDELMDDFVAGQRSFEDTVERILVVCREQYPEFLESVARAEEGASPQERVARNIVRHFEKTQQHGRSDVRERLHAELADYLKKLGRGPMTAGAA